MSRPTPKAHSTIPNCHKGLDHAVFPTNHPLHQYVIYDSDSHEYYNPRTDIFLSEDDIMFYSLRPYSQIDCPLPSPIPSDYFTNWKEDETL